MLPARVAAVVGDHRQSISPGLAMHLQDLDHLLGGLALGDTVAPMGEAGDIHTQFQVEAMLFLAIHAYQAVGKGLPQLLVKPWPTLANLCSIEVIGNQDLTYRLAAQLDVMPGQMTGKSLDSQALTFPYIFLGQLNYGADQRRGLLGRLAPTVGNDQRRILSSNRLFHSARVLTFRCRKSAERNSSTWDPPSWHLHFPGRQNFIP